MANGPETLQAKRDRLWAAFEAQGFRNPELADEIDALDAEIKKGDK